MIKTYITTSIECDECFDSFDVEATPSSEAHIDLNEIEIRAEEECLGQTWGKLTSTSTNRVVHLCPDCWRQAYMCDFSTILPVSEAEV